MEEHHDFGYCKRTDSLISFDRHFDYFGKSIGQNLF